MTSREPKKIYKLEEKKKLMAQRLENNKRFEEVTEATHAAFDNFVKHKWTSTGIMLGRLGNYAGVAFDGSRGWARWATRAGGRLSVGGAWWGTLRPWCRPMDSWRRGWHAFPGVPLCSCTKGVDGAVVNDGKPEYA